MNPFYYGHDVPDPDCFLCSGTGIIEGWFYKGACRCVIKEREEDKNVGDNENILG